MRPFLAALICFVAAAANFSRAQQNRETISKENALKAIATFRAEPTTERGHLAAAMIVQFATDSPDVEVTASPKLLPWMETKPAPEQAGTLLAAYIAGSVRVQLESGRKKHDALAGEEQVIATYQQLQQATPGLRIDAVEKLIALQKQGKLKEHLESGPTPLLQQGNARVVLVGDSITGQSRNHPAGYAHQIDRALQQAYPGCHPNVVALGGSGQGVQAWLNTEKRSRTEAFPLDVKGIEVKAALDQPADVLIIMLGMNDVLAPYVVDEPASWEKWTANYRELITSLQSRLKPKITAVATATLCTEDFRHSPKNAVMDRLNEHLVALAAEMRMTVLPTNQTMRDALERGRQANSEFHVTHDYVHPNEAGHLAIAIGMLRGLGELAAAHALQEQLGAIFQKAASHSSAPTPPSAPWVVAAGAMRQPWNAPKPENLHGPIEEAIEHQGDFMHTPDAATGRVLAWKQYAASVDYTGGANPDSVDFAAVTHAQNFEAGYGARWIHSDRDRPVNIELSTQTFASTLQMGLWLNGTSLYAGLLTGELGKKKAVAAQLHAGWNTLVFALNHTAWQMQCTVHVAGVDGDTLGDLRYSIAPHDGTP